MTQIEKELYAEIKKHGYNEVSASSGVAVHTLKNWVYGHTVPSIENFIRVANSLHYVVQMFNMLPDEIIEYEKGEYNG